tara:strand:+ start:360 stop:1241 length:882 start_codon:yes stop_codon:yes gene_type:complete
MDYIPWEVLSKVQTKIVEHCKKNNIDTLDLAYSGGEPLWHPEILKIIKGASEYEIDAHISITTNLSRKLDFLKQMVNVIKENNIKLTISTTLHKEFVNTDKKFNDYINKLKFLKESNISVSVNLVMTKEMFWEQAKQSEDIRKLGIPIVLKHIRDNNDTMVDNLYDDDMIRYMKEAHVDQNKPSIIWIDEEGNKHELVDQLRTVVHNIRNYYKFYCNSGYTSVSMDFDGTMFRGYACYDVHKLGNAYNNDWQLLDDCMPCEYNGNCLPTDIVSVKSKDKIYNNVLRKFGGKHK